MRASSSEKLCARNTWKVPYYTVTNCSNTPRNSFYHRTTRHKRGINTIAISTNNDCWVATGDGEGNVFLWN